MKNKTTIKPETIQTTWEIFTYDVWGNKKDGYEINDRFGLNRNFEIESIVERVENTAHPFDHTSITDRQIKKIFGLSPNLKITVEGDDTNYYIWRASDDYPIGEMFCVSHDSLSPIVKNRIRCDSCNLISINGVVCHERGCYNQDKNWNSELGEWESVEIEEESVYEEESGYIDWCFEQSEEEEDNSWGNCDHGEF